MSLLRSQRDVLRASDVAVRQTVVIVKIFGTYHKNIPISFVYYCKASIPFPYRFPYIWPIFTYAVLVDMYLPGVVITKASRLVTLGEIHLALTKAARVTSDFDFT